MFHRLSGEYVEQIAGFLDEIAAEQMSSAPRSRAVAISGRRRLRNQELGPSGYLCEGEVTFHALAGRSGSPEVETAYHDPEQGEPAAGGCATQTIV